MTRLQHPSVRRIALIALAFLLLLPVSAVTAQPAGQEILVTLNYTRPDGTPAEINAIPAGYPGYEDAWWLYVNGDAQGDPNAALTVTDPLGMYPGGFSIAAGTPVSQYYVYDAAGALTGMWIDLQGLGANREVLRSYRLFVSLTRELPDPPEPFIQPAVLTIHYLDQNGQEFASEQRTLEAGQHVITPDAARVPADYQLISAPEQYVTVGQAGAEPNIVSFTYQPVIQPAALTVRYLDQNGQEFASEQRTLEAGQHVITPDAARVPADYQLISAPEQYVAVGQAGAEPNVVSFTYQPVIQPAVLTVRYLDEQGSQVAPPAQMILEPGTHNVYAQPADLQAGYSLTVPDVQSVTVDASGANPPEIIFIYRASQPEPTAQSAQVRIIYADEGGNQVADSQTVLLQPGTHIVTPSPSNLLPDYQLISAGSVEVTVGLSGAVPAEVMFTYRLIPPVSQPISVTVSYVDLSGNRVASDTVFMAGEGKNAVQPVPSDLLEGYSLAPGEDAVKYVTVVNNAAQPVSLTFLYEKRQETTPTPVPPPKAALVSVLYRSEAGDVLFSENVPCKEGEQTLIAVDLSRIDAQHYQLVGQDSAVITLDSSGNPSQKEVVFTFRDTTVKSAVLTLHYRDEAGNAISPSQTLTIKAGEHQIQARPDPAPEGMELISASPVTVTLSQSGILSQQEIIFIYRRPTTPPPPPTPSPEPTALPFDLTTMDRYAYPISDNINFRSSPGTTQSGNILSTLNRTDLAHILGSVKNAQGEEWYLADVKGQEGFLKATVVRLLDYSEAAALFGWTPTPSPAPTPQQGLPSDGQIIDRWAEVTDRNGVNFRTKPSTGSTKISQLERGERFWVYTQETVGGRVWYSIMANGRKGYVMAEYARLFTQQESAQYQATLATPMPYSVTPTPTLPAVTATPVPTQPSATPVPVTPEPVSYHGYALTTLQAALRTGANRLDEPVLEMIEANSLVYVWGQTFVGNEGWSNVQVMADSAYGYLPNSALRTISEQEAASYLAQLQPQATATPVPTSLPEQRTGYAITMGDNVPMRAFADTNAQILNLLPNSSIADVRGQEYVAGSVWHLIQYGAGYGYVRADQMRLLSPAETTAYLDSLRTPTPAPAATLPPVTMDSPSSYGYVNTDKVRLRSGPSTASRELKLMNKHAFALVYGSSTESDGVWYRISQGGTTGYVHGNFFTVLPMGELSSYLQSPDYLNANSVAIPATGGSGQGASITPVEDYNATVWQNPNLINPSYEPFNPLGTPTPPVEAIFTPSPVPSESPSPSPVLIEEFPEPPEKADSSFPTGLLAVGLIVLLGGGGYYAYHLYQQNQKRAAARSAQRRAQLAQQNGQPQARPAQQQPVSPYAPPRTGTPQGTAQFRPTGMPPVGNQPGQTPQGTAQYRPTGMPPVGNQPGQTPQGTAQYRPAGMPPVGSQPGQTPQGTVQYRPGPQVPPQGPAQARPLDTAQPQGTSGAEPKQNAAGETGNSPSQAGETRRRRSDRHGNA